jgi:hypothetical protein
MRSPVLEPPSAQEVPKSTFNARADVALEMPYWGLRATTPITLVTVDARFQEILDSDVLSSRLVEQEVLDLLDAPPTSR